jgi:hypothetical protein
MVSGRFLSQGREWWGYWAVFSEIFGAAWLHVRTLAVAAPVRWLWQGVDEARGTLCGRARLHRCILDTFSIQARPFYDKLGYRALGRFENHPVGHQHYFMTKKLDSAK